MKEKQLHALIVVFNIGVCSITLGVYACLSVETPKGLPSSATHSSQPPTDFSNQEDAIDDLYLEPGLWAEVSIVDRGAALELKWHKSHAGTGIKTEIAVSATQKLAIQAKATSVAAGKDGELIVCAKLPNGETRITRLLVAAPQVAAEPAGARLVPQPPLETAILYQAAEVGKDTVSLSVRNRGLDDHYLMRFDETKDLFDVDLGTQPPAFVRVAAASQTPGLDADFSSFHVGEHKTAGYVYEFQVLDLDFFRVATILGLIDSNRDGTLDYVGPIDADMDQKLDLIGIDNWVEVLGIPAAELGR